MMNAIRTIECLKATIQRRLSDFLELSPHGAAGETRAVALDAQIDDLRVRLGKALAARRRIGRASAPAGAGNLEQKAEFAILRGRDDLARAAVRKIQERKVRNLKIAQELAALDAEVAGLEASLLSIDRGDASAALAAMLKELEALIAEANDAPSTEG